LPLTLPLPPRRDKRLRTLEEMKKWLCYSILNLYSWWFNCWWINCFNRYYWVWNLPSLSSHLRCKSGLQSGNKGVCLVSGRYAGLWGAGLELCFPFMLLLLLRALVPSLDLEVEVKRSMLLVFSTGSIGATMTGTEGSTASTRS